MSLFGSKLVSKATEREYRWLGILSRWQEYRDNTLYTYASDCTATSDTIAGLSSTATFVMTSRNVREINPVYYRVEEVWRLKGTWATPVP